jgi:hypothetical protein
VRKHQEPRSGGRTCASVSNNLLGIMFHRLQLHGDKKPHALHPLEHVPPRQTSRFDGSPQANDESDDRTNDEMRPNGDIIDP